MSATTNLIRSGEAARSLGISQTYLARLAKSGQVEFTETALGRLYDAADIERLRRERATRAREVIAA